MKNINKSDDLKIKKTKTIKEDYLIELLDILYEKQILKKKWRKFKKVLKNILDADNIYIDIYPSNKHLKLFSKSKNISISSIDNIKIIKQNEKITLVLLLDLLNEKFQIVIENPKTLTKSDLILLKKIQTILRLHVKDEKDRREILEHLYIDPLTGLYNRYFLNTVIPIEIEKVKRYKQNLGIIFIDIDNFKEINDKYGHLIGDKVLSMIGKLIRKSIRKTDIPIRVGGDEILIILPFTSKEQAIFIATKLKNLIEKNKFKFDDTEISLTISSGVSEISRDMSFLDVIEKVDKALLKAKKEGKNRIVIV